MIDLRRLTGADRLKADARVARQREPDAPVTKIPPLLALGDQDSLMTSVRAFSEQLTGLKVEHQYIEKPGLDHGTIIMGGMPDYSSSCRST